VSILNFNLSGFGLDITDKSIKLVQAVPVNNKYRLQAWGQVNIKPGLIEQGDIIKPEAILVLLNKLIGSLEGRLTSELAVVSLPETKSFLKLFKLKKVSGEEKKDDKDLLVKAIETELPKEIPLPLNNMVYDYQVVRESSNHWHVLVGAVPRDIVLEYTELIKKAGFKPLALEIEAQSITRALIYGENGRSKKSVENKSRSKIKLDFLGKILPKKIKQSQSPSKNLNNTVKQSASPPKSTIITDLGANRSSLIVYHHETIQFTRTLELSGAQLSQTIANKLGLTLQKAEQAKIICGLDPKKCKDKVRPLFNAWVQELTREIKATISYSNTLNGLNAAPQPNILLCGGGAGLIGLAELLQKSLDLEVEVAVPLQKFIEPKKTKLIPSKSVLGYTTAIGLALR